MTRVAIAWTTALLVLATIVSCKSATQTTGLLDPSVGPYPASTAVLDHDALLAARVTSLLQTDPMMRGAEIRVSVSQGRARLSGFVGNAAAKLRAAELTQRAEGIYTVENRLILRYRANLSIDPLNNVRVRL